MRSRIWKNAGTFALLAVTAATALAFEGGAADAGHAAPDAHGGGDTIIDKLFRGGIGNSLITLVVFGIVVLILGSKAWPSLIKVLHEREKLIRDSLETAKREREEAEKLLVQYKKQIEQARVDATAIVDEGRRDAEVVRRRMQDEARKESDEMIARAKREIQLATDSAVKELYDRTAELAVNVAGGIIKKELRPDDHRALVTESLQRMTATKN